MKPATLTIAEVDALFSGRPMPLSGPVRPPTTAPARLGHYDRCAACKTIQPALLTFMGDTDWSPSIPLDSPIRAAVTRLRVTTGRRTILLCSGCAEALQIPATRPEQAVDIARLFEP